VTLSLFSGWTKVVQSEGREIVFNACKSLEAETELVTGQKWVQERIK